MFIAGLYESPFQVKAEKSIAIQEEDEALAQLLTYMLADPDRETLTFGMISTGANFSFVKLVRGETLQYARSAELVISNPGNELYRVLQILKRLSQLPD